MTRPRGTIDRTIGVGNGTFLAHVATGMSRDELVKNWREGRYPDLHEPLARDAMAWAGMGRER